MSLNKMTVFREIRPGDDPVMAEIIRSNLRAVGLDIPGTAYYDDNLVCKINVEKKYGG